MTFDRRLFQAEKDSYLEGIGLFGEARVYFGDIEHDRDLLLKTGVFRIIEGPNRGQIRRINGNMYSTVLKTGDLIFYQKIGSAWINLMTGFSIRAQSYPLEKKCSKTERMV